MVGEPSRDRNGDLEMMDVMKMIGAFTNYLESFTRRFESPNSRTQSYKEITPNTKRFLSVLVVFGKYLVFTKTENFKNSVALFWRLSCGLDKLHAISAFSQVSFGDLFASERSSCEGYTEIFVAQLATLSRVRLLVAKNT